MFSQQLGTAFLALLNVVNAANSCCFVVQEEAHEVYWEEYVTEVHTTTVNLTSITTLLTPYPTTTITNYETHVYPITKVLTTTFLVTENPVALYTNPAFDVPQKTEILSGSQPTITGGVTIASPIGFWVYRTAKIFTAPPVTDSNGNVACGTVLSFANVASDVPACVPTFTAINSNAAAYFDINGAQGVMISLTTPFVHIPTRTDLQVSPTELCVQGNGTENYGYPAQELINHLAANPVYRAQYPGIENCLPAGPSIKAVQALAITVSAGADAATTDVASTETPTTGGLTSDTTTVVTPTTSVTSTSLITSTSSVPVSTSTTLVTTTSIPALPESSSSTIPPPTGGETETPIGSGGLIPSTSTPETSTSTVIVSPLPQTELSSSSTESSVSTESTSPQTSALSSTSSGSVSTASSSSTILTSTSTSVSIETTSSSSIVSSSLIVSSSSVTTSSPTTGVESTSTSTEALPSVTIVPVTTSAVSTVIVGTGSTPSTTPIPSPTPLFASSPKDGIPWHLLVGFLGFIAVGIW